MTHVILSRTNNAYMTAPHVSRKKKVNGCYRHSRERPAHFMIFHARCFMGLLNTTFLNIRPEIRQWPEKKIASDLLNNLRIWSCHHPSLFFRNYYSSHAICEHVSCVSVVTFYYEYAFVYSEQHKQFFSIFVAPNLLFICNCIISSRFV